MSRKSLPQQLKLSIKKLKPNVKQTKLNPKQKMLPHAVEKEILNKDWPKGKEKDSLSNSPNKLKGLVESWEAALTSKLFKV